MSVFSSVLAICLIVFSSFLVTTTLQIQHSCQPMIHWSGDFPAECQVANNDEFKGRDREQSLVPETVKNKPDSNNLLLTEKPESTKTHSNSQLERAADNSRIADLKNTFNTTKTEAKAKFDSAEKLEKKLLQVDRDVSNSQLNKSDRNSQLSAAKVALNAAENNSKTQLDTIIEVAKENAGKVAVTAGVVTGAVAIATGMPIALAAIAVAGAGAAVWQSIKSFLQ